jgi:hypothetical protein
MFKETTDGEIMMDEDIKNIAGEGSGAVDKSW